MHILMKLLGSDVRVKMLRLFLFNPGKGYDLEDMVSKLRLRPSAIKKELKLLSSIGLIKKAILHKEKKVKVRKIEKIKKYKSRGFVFDASFPYTKPLADLLVSASLPTGDDLAEHFKSIPRIRLLISAGIFIGDSESRVDVCIVADNVNQDRVAKRMADLESEVGREISYAVFETGDFEYRLGVFDKLIRDILDFPHNKIVNKLGLE